MCRLGTRCTARTQCCWQTGRYYIVDMLLNLEQKIIDREEDVELRLVGLEAQMDALLDEMIAAIRAGNPDNPDGGSALTRRMTERRSDTKGSLDHDMSI